jgi:hypothetical protein
MRAEHVVRAFRCILMAYGLEELGGVDGGSVDGERLPSDRENGS